eukprot:TRINITY_DN16144_c0_g1::TRINITY_DN16144_c0_g1_i1::g.6449::m.6449 TRINITY_DN16144_c0_g1::TRINITY_DN16144_c0_g1_i1::g.6449  ORF type:complete len:183 (-),score=22.33,sp/O88848/ARL6_MOUSE/48.28/2e-53,Arf/PF00025.16/5e-52,Ras/PF00071.17/2e-13,SRPRB/PF09439.5/7.5e-12,Miro/PF08477.8/5.6e-10,GTP_EFTU/PF00009.22/55,GTP_EFTU/PF00009.22/5.3e-08,MMR_HSR1/PF01926.18/5.2e-08,MMR_HSR1/PF01926.18/2.3e+03,Gtr1_RagA/PF04670.7/2.7e-08,G-alpha/PF00503.15/0.73,G-alpha/PF00503.15/2.3e-05,ATP_bind_1/PF03029.12/78,ATP_
MGFNKFLVKLGILKKPCKVAVVGLDSAGKSTIIKKLQPKKVPQDVVPTVGFQVEEFVHGNVKFTVFDMSGHGRYRSLWENFYKDIHGIVFVIDSQDEARMKSVQIEIQQMLSHKDIKEDRDIPVLFFANKMDLPGAHEPAEITEALDLKTLVADRAWHITPSNALTGENLDSGIEWLATHLK